MAAWLHIRAVRDPDRFDAWLNRLLVHACYREARRVKQRQVVEIHMTAPDTRGADDGQELSAMRDQLERGFRRLTPEQRAVLVVHHYLGLPDGEAAVVLDLALGTFKSRLNRAKAALRAALEADERTATVALESIA
jgi:RNA polymerase sigma-70 factor (ECF subfamily)